MPAKDKFHDAVVNALIKDGWTITDDPLKLKFDGKNIYIDLGAERIIAAEKGAHKIAVEVKSFIGTSIMEDVEQAVGQYIVYESALLEKEPEREFFLAVPETVLQRVFNEPMAQRMIKRHNIKVFGYNSEAEEIVTWIN